MIQALYIDPRGPYPALLGAGNTWDQVRNALAYEGPDPVVAHPPCGPWGRLAKFCKNDDPACAIRAIAQVRTFGGVLEHPKGSKLWTAFDLPLPGEHPDAWGFTLDVEQVSWGHVARKPTWLYVCGFSDRVALESEIRTGGTPTHWVRDVSRAQGQKRPAWIKMCSKEQRRRTPLAFAEWLISIANRCAGDPALARLASANETTRRASGRD